MKKIIIGIITICVLLMVLGTISKNKDKNAKNVLNSTAYITSNTSEQQNTIQLNELTDENRMNIEGEEELNEKTIEYYKSATPPIIYASCDEQKVICTKGAYQWSKIIDGETIRDIADSGGDWREFNFIESFIINTEKSIGIETDYKVDNINIQSFYKSDTSKYYIEYNKENKTISFDNIKNGIYVITYKIVHNDDYANYAFKVELQAI